MYKLIGGVKGGGALKKREEGEGRKEDVFDEKWMNKKEAKKKRRKEEEKGNDSVHREPVKQPLLTGALSAFDWLLIKFILITLCGLVLGCLDGSGHEPGTATVTYYYCYCCHCCPTTNQA